MLEMDGNYDGIWKICVFANKCTTIIKLYAVFRYFWR